MKFRPCIDIHNGKVKQIVGGSLKDAGDQAEENFVSEQDAAFFARLYQNKKLSGGHIILLNPLQNFMNRRKDRLSVHCVPIREDCRSVAGSHRRMQGNIWRQVQAM